MSSSYQDDNAIDASLKEKAHYERQLDIFFNSLLLNDNTISTKILTYSVLLEPEEEAKLSKLIWPNNGELVSGSFVMEALRNIFGWSDKIEYDDIDIYFKSKEHAEEFAKLNNFTISNLEHPMCSYVTGNEQLYNLIWGVNYTDAEDLLSKFDIRACSVAFCPNQVKFYTLEDSLLDIETKNIVFNPVPRAISLNRLIKYIRKGFKINPYQRLFFVELLKSHIYSADLELQTKQY